MKPLSPHDLLDDLIAAALHGELTPEQRNQFDTRLQTDPAARAAYQEAQLMHDLLEKTYRNSQPDEAFEQRVVSGVRRKIAQEKQHKETAWESVVVLWAVVRKLLSKRRISEYAIVLVIIGVLVSVTIPAVTGGLKTAKIGERRSLLAFNEKDAEVRDGFDETKAKKIYLPKQAPVQYQLKKEDAQLAANGSGGMIPPSATSAPMVPLPDLAPAPAEASSLAASTPTMTTITLKKPSSEPADSSLRQSFASAKNTIDAWGRDKSGSLTPAVPSDMTTRLPEHATAGIPTTPVAAPPADPSRKLIRNAEMELEVKSFQAAMDQIGTLTKAAGGYVDTSNSQRGGNGKLQGTVVVKVLPQNLDDFLLKLRDVGQLKNQSVKTDDVTKAYFDTQARLENSRRMETQLQELLKRDNGKVSELLQVERELGRVRGEIEQMQGELKLYDFQVQYATVTMQVREKDLNQAAAYLLKEQDDFSLYATDVEGAFQQARHAAEDFKAQILTADLEHNSGSNVSAELTVMVAPDQIEPFLAQVKAMGRVDNFTRQTQRVARDGGDSDQPADQTLTEKDKVQVHLAIRSDDESRKQMALTVVTPLVDDALDKAKSAALAGTGAEILSSSLNKTPQGQSTAQLSVRVPGKNYHGLLDVFRALGRTASFSLQRNDNSGPGADGDDAPVIVSLSLTDEETPLQQTNLSVSTSGVDDKARQIKKDAAVAGVEVKASSFEREPDGMEMAQMTFRLPMSKYPAFVENLKKLGKVESLTVHREDRPDQARADETAPAEINLRMHSQSDIVTDDNGLWATLRQTFGEGAGALFGSVRTIGVMAAFLAPWVFALVLLAWTGRRIYVWRKS